MDSALKKMVLKAGFLKAVGNPRWKGRWNEPAEDLESS